MPQAEEAELFRVQPDRPPEPVSDAGIHSWPYGSYAPMGFYRPAPIVRFTGTVIGQSVLNVLLYALLEEERGSYTVVACAAIALVLGRRAHVLWLGAASRRWKLATFGALALNLLFVSLLGTARGCATEDFASAPDRGVVASERCAPSNDELLEGYREV